MAEELTSKQKAFIEQFFINNMNATKAAIAAGYSEKSAGSIGSENLQKPKIARVINERLKALAMPAEEAIARLADFARSDIGDILDDDGNVDIQKAKRLGKTHLIKSIAHSRYKTKDFERDEVRVDIYDAQTAVREILKALNKTTQDNEITIKVVYGDGNGNDYA